MAFPAACKAPSPVLVSVLLIAAGVSAQSIPQIPSVPFTTTGSYVEGELLPSFTFTPETDVTVTMDTCGTFLMSGNAGNAGILLLEIPSDGNSGKTPGPLTTLDISGAVLAGISILNQQQFCSADLDPVGFDLVLPEITLTANTQYLITLSIVVSLDYVFTISGPETANIALPSAKAGDAGLSASVKSDPHMLGFRGQSFDFTGQAGGIYCLITDSALVLNSQFSTAYAPAGAALSEGSLMHATGGTWISSIGLQIPDSDVRLMVSVEPNNHKDAITASSAKSGKKLMHGAVELNGEALNTVGEYQADALAGIELELSNSKSFSRVSLSSATLVLDIDIVSPPAEWQVADDDEEKYSHLNLSFHKVVLSETAHGVLGQTSRLKLDVQGNAVMESSEMNGSGLIDGASEDYVVPSLFSPAPLALAQYGQSAPTK